MITAVHIKRGFVHEYKHLSIKSQRRKDIFNGQMRCGQYISLA